MASALQRSPERWYPRIGCLQKYPYLCAMREKMKQRVVQYVVLMAGILALLSVVIPHHHHRDGMPCYQSLTAEQAHGDKSTDTHDCGCDGHNLAYFSTHISHFMDGDVDIHLMPLLVLFDYIYPPEPAFCGQLLDHENAPYIESLHDTWIVSASGLRAPPMS